MHPLWCSTLFLCLCLLLATTLAHESCCKHKLAAAAGKQEPDVDEFIVNVTDVAPKIYEGEARYIEDTNRVKPDYWNDEDDGEWEPIFVANPNYTWKPRMVRNPNYSKPPNLWNKLITEIKSAIPWVVLGILITGILTTITTSTTTNMMLSSSSSSSILMNYLKAALLGLATPLCSCGALPLASGLLSSSDLSSVFVFLVASQSAGLDSAAITWGLLGSTAVLCRLGGAILLALSVGFAIPSSCNNTFVESTTTKKDDDKNKVTTTTSSSCCSSNGNGTTTNTTTKSTSSSFSSAISAFIHSVLENTSDIFPTVILGLAASTALLHYLPSLLQFPSEGESSSLLLRLGVLVSVIPLQLCEHTSVALAAMIQKAAGESSSSGLAFAFLLSAPAVNTPTLLLLLRSTTSVVIVLKALLALCTTSLVLSYAVDYMGIDLMVHLDGSSSMAELPRWYTQIAPYIALSMVLFSAVAARKKKMASSCCDTTTEKRKTE
mmetsp:Transcript_14732/g.16872  ORF Transcript_14732/g.16872 Transcript_14732/m.16872 type:complete len:492 (+) Transcript_14732:125-1600(+)